MDFWGLDIGSPMFWSAFGSILLANIVLSGENAVVIAMAARTLEPQQRNKAIFWGGAATIVMHIVLTVVAIELLTLPYLKIIGALLLVYIGVDLLRGESEDDGQGKEIQGLAAAKGNLPLLVLGLLVSIPLIIFGATLLTKVMERLPIIITIGAALLGFLAGEMLLTDPAVKTHLGSMSETAITIGGLVGAILVVLIGQRMRQQQAAAD